MLVREAMSAPVVTVRARDGVRRAAELLLEHRIASVPVVDDAGGLVGVVGEADLLRGRHGQDPRAHLRAHLRAGTPVVGAVADVMTAPAVAVPPTADAAEAARTLLELGVSALPVVERGRVVGVIARRDLLRALVRTDADVGSDVDALLNGPSAAAVGVIPPGGPTGAWVASVADGAVVLAPAPGWLPDAAHRRLAAMLAREVPGVVVVDVAPRDDRDTTDT